MYLKLLIIITLTIFSISQSIGQNELTTNSKRAAKRFYEAIDLYNINNDRGALEKLKLAIGIDDNFVEAYLFIADIHFGYKDYEKEIVMLKKAIEISPNYNKKNYFNIAQAYILVGNYEEALDNFNHYLSLDPSGKVIEVAENYISNCEYALEALENPVIFNPINLGVNVNTLYDDIMPSLTADEETMVTTVVLPIDPNFEYNIYNSQEDFFISHKVKSKWSTSKNMGHPVNTPKNEGAQSISVDGKIMVFAACDRSDGAGSCDIYFSKKQGNNWSKPINIGPPINTGAWESQPSLSSDGRSIYFASNRPGGYGMKDIWVSHLDKEGYWSDPVNLGPNINTKKVDASPFIHPDNSTLYFSSNGHTGMGGYDLFFSRITEEGDFPLPFNLGYPINTFKDEEFMIVNAKGDKAYFSSNRPDSRRKDIYFFELYEEARPIPVSYLKGHVFDSNNQHPVNAKFELIDLETSETIIESFSGSDGEYFICLPTNKNYALNVSKDNYLFYSANFSLKGIFNAVRPFIIDVSLKPIEQGKSVILENVFYETDSYILKSESMVELNKLSEFLKKNNGINIEIGGHTDNSGTKEHNLNLSRNRARSVYSYLIEDGINQERLKFVGYGMRKPIADNTTKEGKAKNRRTEFTIIN